MKRKGRRRTRLAAAKARALSLAAGILRVVGVLMGILLKNRRLEWLFVRHKCCSVRA